MGPEVTELGKKWWKWRGINYIILCLHNIFKGLVLCNCTIVTSFLLIKNVKLGVLQGVLKICGYLCERKDSDIGQYWFFSKHWIS